jgi:hypothetical protein
LEALDSLDEVSTGVLVDYNICGSDNNVAALWDQVDNHFRGNPPPPLFHRCIIWKICTVPLSLRRKMLTGKMERIKKEEGDKGKVSVEKR